MLFAYLTPRVDAGGVLLPTLDTDFFGLSNVLRLDAAKAGQMGWPCVQCRW